MSAWLDLWNNGGCDILYYTIEWKKFNSIEWISNADKVVSPTDRIYTVGALEAETKYQLKVTAYNNIGSSFVIYNFTTFTINGGKF